MASRAAAVVAAAPYRRREARAMSNLPNILIHMAFFGYVAVSAAVVAVWIRSSMGIMGPRRSRR